MAMQPGHRSVKPCCPRPLRLMYSLLGRGGTRSSSGGLGGNASSGTTGLRRTPSPGAAADHGGGSTDFSNSRSTCSPGGHRFTERHFLMPSGPKQ
eukprot:6144701-Lingulodinium_polyedra.AAC.1